VRVRVRAVLVSLNFLYPSIRVRTAPSVSVRVRDRVRVSLSFSGCALKLTLPSDYRTFGLSIQNPYDEIADLILELTFTESAETTKLDKLFHTLTIPLVKKYLRRLNHILGYRKIEIAEI